MKENFVEIILDVNNNMMGIQHTVYSNEKSRTIFTSTWQNPCWNLF